MKKIFCTIAVLTAFSTGMFADEGMWMLPLLQKMNGKAMSVRGARLTPEQIYSINQTSLKDAIVQFGGGCTGEVISNEGLIVTNHHCGYGSIQKLSSPEHNYLEDGFWAMNRSQELPVPGLTVKFLERMTDVSPILEKVYSETLKQHKDSTNRESIASKAVAETVKALEKQAEAENEGCTATVTSYYNDNVHYLLVYKIFRDIRFVGAPPASLGKFGGDTDNWMWPRQTCDFSMFRIYAGKDNNPADYSSENIPYTPKRALKISLRGINDGDFTMVMGYPGRTQRFQTASQLRDMFALNDIRIAARTELLDVMLKGMAADPAVRLKYANKHAGTSNGWKKWQGARLAAEKLDILGREERKEAEFMQWVDKNRKRTEKYGSAIADIAAAVEETAQDGKDMTLLLESAYKIGTMGIVSAFHQAYSKELKASNDSVAAINAGKTAAEGLYKDFDLELEKKIAAAMLGFYRDRARLEMYIEIPGENFAEMDFKAYSENLFATSIFASREKLLASGNSFHEIMKDPAVMLYNAVMKKLMPPYRNVSAGQNKVKEASKAFTAGLLEWKKGEPSYPDANSTMRLSYGTVKSYSPRDGVLYKHYTTLAGVMEKEDPDNYEFRVPARLKELYKAKDFGLYADAEGRLPACFLTDNDITGGNSGSPVLDADGALIGLAFDGNWESMSSDIMFEPDLQRCICVDIRYVLFIVDKFGGAGYLLDEMQFKN